MEKYNFPLDLKMRVDALYKSSAISVSTLAAWT